MRKQARDRVGNGGHCSPCNQGKPVEYVNKSNKFRLISKIQTLACIAQKGIAKF